MVCICEHVLFARHKGKGNMRPEQIDDVAHLFFTVGAPNLQKVACLEHSKAQKQREGF